QMRQTMLYVRKAQLTWHFRCRRQSGGPVNRFPNVAVRVACITLIPIILAMLVSMRRESNVDAAVTTAAGSLTMVRPACEQGQSSADPTPADDEATAPWAEQDEEESVDLYGNQVTDAIARYKLHADGNLYELQSPRIELPRLSSPKG